MGVTGFMIESQLLESVPHQACHLQHKELSDNATEQTVRYGVWRHMYLGPGHRVSTVAITISHGANDACMQPFK